MKLVNQICFTVCLVCVVGGVTISILGLWKVLGVSDAFWRSLMTLGVLFFGCLIVSAMNAYFSRLMKDK